MGAEIDRLHKALFPAYAGVIPERRTAGILIETFPRLRGGDPFILPDLMEYRRFSPPTRG